MTRIEKLEKIILGTLLESDSQKNYFTDCRCCITADMFSDEVGRRIYRIISDMNMKGITETDPCTIAQTYGEDIMDILPVMLDLVTDYSFIHLKMQHNERAFLLYYYDGIKPEYTYVSFTDYVNAFLKHYEDEKRKEFVRADAAAARSRYGERGIGYAYEV